MNAFSDYTEFTELHEHGGDGIGAGLASSKFDSTGSHEVVNLSGFPVYASRDNCTVRAFS
jgi:hypothetical protein